MLALGLMDKSKRLLVINFDGFPLIFGSFFAFKYMVEFFWKIPFCFIIMNDSIWFVLFQLLVQAAKLVTKVKTILCVEL